MEESESFVRCHFQAFEELIAGTETNFVTKKDRYGNVFLIKTPGNIKDPCIVGIDEAGRGPLAGPLVYTAIFWNRDPETKVYSDSKKVGAEKRSAQFADILLSETVGFVSCALSPLFISLNMLNSMRDAEIKSEKNRIATLRNAKKKVKLADDGVTPKGNTLGAATACKKFLHADAVSGAHRNCKKLYESRYRQNLNELSFSCVGMILQAFVRKMVSVSAVFMDALGSDARVPTRVILEAMKGAERQPSVAVEIRADSKYQVVSAASVVSKVIRDMFLMNPKMQMEVYKTAYASIGSGYPSDEITQRWLRSVYSPVVGVPHIVRSSWKPVLQLLAEKMPAEITARGRVVCKLSTRRGPR